MVGSSFFMPSGRPAGRPWSGGADRRLAGDEGARPAVQLCCPYQSVNSAPRGRCCRCWACGSPSSVVVGADVELADVVAPDDEDVRLPGGRRLLGLRDPGGDKGAAMSAAPSKRVILDFIGWFLPCAGPDGSRPCVAAWARIGLLAALACSMCPMHVCDQSYNIKTWPRAPAVTPGHRARRARELRAAAAACTSAKPALSRSIRNVERQFGSELFLRTAAARSRPTWKAVSRGARRLLRMADDSSARPCIEAPCRRAGSRPVAAPIPRRPYSRVLRGPFAEQFRGSA